MLTWSLIFLAVSLIAGFFGFGGVANIAKGFAKVLFIIFLILFIITLILHIFPGMIF